MYNFQRHILNFAALMALLNILGFYISTFFETESTAASVTSLLLNGANIFLLYYAIMDYFKKSKTKITFAQVLKLGFFISLFAGLLYGFYVFVYYEFFNPGYKDSLIQIAIDKMMERAEGLPEDQIQSSIEMLKTYFSYMAFAGAVINILFIGLITSIITGLWKKEA